MEICVLASGSSGNCFYIEKNNNAILIDAGISTKQIVNRLFSIGKNPLNVKGIFITHEHSDHIKGADVFARKFKIPIFATGKTIDSCNLCSNEDFINKIRNNETVNFCGMDIESFSKSHRAVDPVSFNIYDKKKISIMTDIGYACQNVVDNVGNSDLLCLESNYDPEMLKNGGYPHFLKKWIESDIGHLSNGDSAKCVFENSSSKLKYLVLSHLSKNNNHPDVAMRSFQLLKKKNSFPKIFVSERERPTAIFKI
ncbi:MBL fold metallo-hydrolase [Candidatus Pacearchaeota archaeon]|nr:MBL fold metallo-hydrolase [Candidatus Pacearchaeota archaeon]